MLISCDWVPTTFHGRDKQAAGIWRGARTRIKSVLQARRKRERERERERERVREAREVAKRKLKSRRISSGRQRGGGSADGVGGAEHSRQISDDSHERLMPIPLS